MVSAWARPLILISTTDLPTQVRRLSCTRSTLAIHGVHTRPCKVRTVSTRRISQRGVCACLCVCV
jgi:hypothetical protein